MQNYAMNKMSKFEAEPFFSFFPVHSIAQGTNKFLLFPFPHITICVYLNL